MGEQPQQQIMAPPPLSAVEGIAMAAHTVAITNATEMRLHREECNRRDERNEGMFKEIREANTKIAENLTKLTEEGNQKHVENVEKMNDIAAASQAAVGRLAVKVAWIMGGISVATLVINAIIAIGVAFFHR
jgi:hypothetical protein